jgi:ubiquinone/menaquinone biosynthesis C-methylase UbiE
MDKKEIVRLGYNKSAEVLAQIFGFERGEEEEEVKSLFDFSSRIPLGGKILDAGCGSGAYSKILNKKYEVIGVDISEKQIELARQKVPNVKFICQDMAKVSFKDEYFDGILSFYSIIHIPREEHREVLKNFYRMLKSRGVFLSSFHNIDDPESYHEDFFGTGATMFWSGFDKNTNLQMVQDVGFKIIWSKLVQESPKFGGSYHLFVLAQR